jgi:hypothetical protein
VRKRSLKFTLAALTLLWAGAAWAGLRSEGPGPSSACQQNKLLAQGELADCLKFNPAQATECLKGFAAVLAQIDRVAAGAGEPCRYIDNGDGTVYDMNENVTWEKKTGTVGGGDDLSDPHNVNNLYTWSSTGSAADGTVFTSFLSMLNDSSSGCFARHCDWGLPSIEQLTGILNRPCGARFPCIDGIFGPTQASVYWTDTGIPPSADFIWGVDFQGYTGLYKKTGPPLYVRAMHSGM